MRARDGRLTIVEPTLTARALLPLLSGLRALGHDAGRLLEATGIDPAALEEPDARVPMSAGVGLLALAADETGDECIGLHLAEHADLRTVDVHYYAMLASATLAEGYRRLSRFQRLIHETSRVDVVVEGEATTLRHVLPGGLAAPRHTAEFLLAAWVRTGRLAAARDWSPLGVRFAHAAPGDVREHERFFRAPVVFSSGENAVRLGASVLALPCAGADAALAALVDRHAAWRLPPGPVPGTFADRVRGVLVELLRDGEPRAAATAARLKMSVRTLTRTLTAEGTSYRALLDQLRHELAGRHLADPRTSIGEVAFLVGFSELSAFHRAFKRWTGQTPAEFRRQARSPATSASAGRRPHRP